MKEEVEYVEGKVNWRGKPATKDKHGGMQTALFLLGTYALENLVQTALAVNLVTYFNGVMHFNIADAANEVTNYSGTTFILSIPMAILADTCLGRFKTLLIALCIEFTGLILLGVQSHHPKLKPPQCNIFIPTAHCLKVSGRNAVLLFLSLYMVAIGTSGVKAALPSLGADQFDEKDPKGARDKSSFFNWFLLAFCIGSVGSLTFLVWIQDNKGWDWGFLVSCLAILLSTIVLLFGLPWYRVHVIQRSNPIFEIIQVYVAAIRNRKLKLPENHQQLYEIDTDSEAVTDIEFLPHTHAFRFLDKAAIKTSNSTPWKLCRVTQVENAKIFLGLIPIFCCTIMMTVCLAQLQTLYVQQGITMDTRIGKSFHIPPASLPIFPVVCLLVLIPLYDRVGVPFLRRFTGIPTGITHLQRIGVGLVLSSISMAVAGLMEVKRKKVARDHNMLDAIPVLQPLPISVFWLSFQYSIFGIADMFTFVGVLEFFYSQAPKSLKSIGTCFHWTSMALGYYLSTIMVKCVNSATKGITRSGGWLAGNNINRNHLNLFFWLLSVLSLINFCGYLFFATRYKYRSENTEFAGNKSSKELIGREKILSVPLTYSDNHLEQRL